MQLRAIGQGSDYRIYTCESSVGINEYKYIELQIDSIPTCEMNEWMSPDRKPGVYLSKEMFKDEVVRSLMELPDSIMKFLFNQDFSLYFHKVVYNTWGSWSDCLGKVDWEKRQFRIFLEKDYHFKFHLYYMIGYLLSEITTSWKLYEELTAGTRANRKIIEACKWVYCGENYILKQYTHQINERNYWSDFIPEKFSMYNPRVPMGIYLAFLFLFETQFKELIKRRPHRVEDEFLLKLAENLIMNAEYLPKCYKP